MHELKQHDLGKFQLAVDAVRAYDKRPTDLKGEKCGINFKNDVMHETAKAKEIAEQDEGVKLVEVNKVKNDVNDFIRFLMERVDVPFQLSNHHIQRIDKKDLKMLSG